MKYGMNLLLWTGDVTEEHFPLLEKIKGWGYDGVELPFFDLTPERYVKVGKKLDDLGLERTAVTICTDDENPIGEAPALRKAGLERLKKAVDCCAAAGCTHLVGPIHSAIGRFTGQGRTTDEWNWAKETLSQAADHAKANNVMLVFEYLNRFECYFANCAADAAKFTREVNHPNLKMMYDTFHANIEEKGITEAIRTCADQMVHVHISENDRSTPGEGHVHWDETFKALKEVNYDGWLMIEAFGLALPEIAAATKIWRRMFPNEEHLATKGLAFMKRNWEGK
ncbi:MAG: sugar phosphate isomerase/epimerase [Planctomycetota bacterium]|nr:sugar phosphate isomerase/epimerase [Planctomycetaceae bacterium]MDQ3332328.1 sugar phosphate isomerase/epimerase [Planctomycetota bacterium]